MHNIVKLWGAAKEIGLETAVRTAATVAALAYCRNEGYLTVAPSVWLPERPPSKDRWLSRNEAARLIWAARSDPKARHLCRFILIALYTGTRKGAILRLQWVPNSHGGHVDLEQGVLFRASNAARSTRKRQTPVRIPRQLLGHMRRWKGLSRLHVVEFRGMSIQSIKRVWGTTCKRAELRNVTPHTLRHTCATWMMQRGAEKWDAVGFLGMTMETLESIYGHHHPDHQASAVGAMERK